MRGYFSKLPRFSDLPRAAGLSAALMVGILLVIVAVSLIGFTSWFVQSRAEIDNIVPRIERFKGYLDAEASLVEAHERLKERLASWAYPATLSQSQAGAQLQQALRGIAEDAGLVVAGSQLVQSAPPIADEEEAAPTFEPLVVRLSMSGPPESVHEFLLAVEGFVPALMIDELAVSRPRLTARQRQRLTRQGRSIDEESLTIQMTVIAQRLL